MFPYWMVYYLVVVTACFQWIHVTDGSPSNLALSSFRFHHHRQFPVNASHPVAHHERPTRGIRTAVSNKPTERKTKSSSYSLIEIFNNVH